MIVFCSKSLLLLLIVVCLIIANTYSRCYVLAFGFHDVPNYNKNGYNNIIISNSNIHNYQQYHVTTIRNKNKYQSIIISSQNAITLSRLYGASISSSAVSASNPAAGLLYKEHEDMLIKRGILEEELMKNNYTPLLANPLPKRLAKTTSSKNIMGKQGFGSASSGIKSNNKTGNNNKTKKNSNKQQQKSGTLVVDTSIFKEEALLHAKVLQEQGVVRIDNVLDTNLVDELRAFVMNLRQDSITKVIQLQNVPAKERFADVLLKTNRCDLKIPLIGGSKNTRIQYNIHTDNTNIVETSLNYVFTQSAIPDTIRTVFHRSNTEGSTRGSSSDIAEPVLYELSTLISDPGSQRQTMHPDNPIQKGMNTIPVLLTCFIALQDVTDDMGPTIYLPGTHTAEYHNIFFDEISHDGQNESPKDHLLRTHPAVLGTLKKGCCAIYDSRILHCGSANKKPILGILNDNNDSSNNDDNSRAIFYFSFRNPLITYPGNPASIRNEIGQAKITLNELQQAIHEAVQLHHQQPNNNNNNPFPWNQ